MANILKKLRKKLHKEITDKTLALIREDWFIFRIFIYNFFKFVNVYLYFTLVVASEFLCAFLFVINNYNKFF